MPGSSLPPLVLRTHAYCALRSGITWLDEPSSALDQESEQLIGATLAALKGKTTIVIVTHRPALLHICDRVVRLEGGRLVPVAHPAAARIAELDPAALVRLRFPAFKAEYLISAARAVASGAIRLSREWSALHLAREMRAIRGIGSWTIQYSLLRGIGFADCLPASDAGLMRGLGRMIGVRPEETAVREMMAKYAPFRSLATYHVWRMGKELE